MTYPALATTVMIWNIIHSGFTREFANSWRHPNACQKGECSGPWKLASNVSPSYACCLSARSQPGGLWSFVHLPVRGRVFVDRPRTSACLSGFFPRITWSCATALCQSKPCFPPGRAALDHSIQRRQSARIIHQVSLSVRFVYLAPSHPGT